jgi:hypothetical protein
LLLETAGRLNGLGSHFPVVFEKQGQKSRGNIGIMMTLGIEDTFPAMRAKAAQGHLVILCPDGQHLILPALPKVAVRPEMLAAVERMLPSTIKRSVAVIGDTAWTTGSEPSLQTANQAIPFFGLLMGFASLGHLVWIFNGAANLLSAGCREADVLVVDSASVATLPRDWKAEAAKVMRNPEILIHDRASYQLRKA